MLGDVGGFVGQHAGQLRFVARRGDQACMYTDETTGQGEGVDTGVAYRKIFETPPRFWRSGRQFVTQACQVILQYRVVQIVGIAAHLPHDLVADLVLLGFGKGDTAGIAEIGQACGQAGMDAEGDEQEGCQDFHGGYDNGPLHWFLPP